MQQIPHYPPVGDLPLDARLRPNDFAVGKFHQKYFQKIVIYRTGNIHFDQCEIPAVPAETHFREQIDLQFRFSIVTFRRKLRSAVLQSHLAITDRSGSSGNALPADRAGETMAIELEFAQRNIGIIRTHAVKELHSAITALNYFRSLK